MYNRKFFLCFHNFCCDPPNFSAIRWRVATHTLGNAGIDNLFSRNLTIIRSKCDNGIIVILNFASYEIEAISFDVKIISQLNLFYYWGYMLLLSYCNLYIFWSVKKLSLKFCQDVCKFLWDGPSSLPATTSSYGLDICIRVHILYLKWFLFTFDRKDVETILFSTYLTLSFQVFLT